MLIDRVLLHDVGPFRDLALSLPAGARADRADVHLLVGPNGAGKSSILSAIAQCFSWEIDTGLAARARSKDAWVGVAAGASWVVVGPQASAGVEMVDGALLTEEHTQWITTRLGDLCPGRPIRWDQDNQVRSYGPRCHWWVGEFVHTFQRWDAAAASLPHLPALSWAAFAYHGHRSLQSAALTGIGEQTDNPLREAASPHRPEGSRPLLQWIANTYAQRAISLMEGNEAAATARAAALQRLCDALGAVIGGPVELLVRIHPFHISLRVQGGDPTPIEQLPDGLLSLLSWLGDLLMRLDRIPWTDPGPVTDRQFLLLLDEVEVHLHPEWQRRVLPMVERLFPRAQILASTHSPFVVASATDAWIHRLRFVDGAVVLDPPHPSAQGMSVSAILDDLMGVSQEFDTDSEALLTQLRRRCADRLAGDRDAEADIESLAARLAARSVELASVVGLELRTLQRQLGLRHP